MLGSQVLEVVVGLVLVYLALSIGSSAINEVLANALSLRSSMLEKGIRNMFRTSAVDYTTQLFTHPLIAATAPPGKKPSYISSRLFSAALLNILVPPNFAQPRTFQSLRSAVSGIPDEKLRSTLLDIIDSSAGDVDTARLNVESWFNCTMERVSGWYKRLAQKIIFGVGLVLSFAANADTFMIVTELWSDQTLRSAVIANAQKTVQASASSDASGQSTSLQQALTEIRATNAPPIGWSRDPHDIRSWPRQLSAGALKLLGVLLTAFAIAMGAPFWFDLLNNLVNLRLSGNPPTPQ